VVESSTNEQWKVNLSAALDPKDAHAIDIKYHLYCWVKHVQRSYAETGCELEGDNVISKVSADIEFYHLMNTLLKSGEILDIADVQDAYHNILNVNGLNAAISRSVKRNLVENFADVEFCCSPRANEPDRIYSSKTKKNVIDDLKEATRDTNKNMKTVFDCAAIIRNNIAMSHKQQPWKFEKPAALLRYLSNCSRANPSLRGSTTDSRDVNFSQNKAPRTIKGHY